MEITLWLSRLPVHTHRGKIMFWSISDDGIRLSASRLSVRSFNTKPLISRSESKKAWPLTARLVVHSVTGARQQWITWTRSTFPLGSKRLRIVHVTWRVYVTRHTLRFYSLIFDFCRLLYLMKKLTDVLLSGRNFNRCMRKNFLPMKKIIMDGLHQRRLS